MSGSTDPTSLGLDPDLARSGVNVAGVLSAESYDALVPESWRAAAILPAARSAIVLGTGGRDFHRALAGSPEAGLRSDPVDRFTRRVVASAARSLRDRGFDTRCVFYWERRGAAGYWERRGAAGKGFADFVALGEAAGLGARSRLALLLHPEFGPWLAVRAVLLTARELAPTRRDAGFEPCAGCPAPCAAACPGDALAADGFDLPACVRAARTQPSCRSGCAARAACVLGRDHRYDAETIARQRQVVLTHLGSEPD